MEKDLLETKREYLNKSVFYGLENLNTGFDAKSIKYFSENDFKIILERVEKLKIAIHGIEPWKDDKFYDVLTFEDFDKESSNPDWYNEAFNVFLARERYLMYAASYDIPLSLLKEIQET